MYWFKDTDLSVPGAPPTIESGMIEKLTEDDIFEELAKISIELPDIPVFELLLMYYPQVCPTGILDPVFNQLLLWEERSQTYGVLPYVGGQLDQPIKLVEAFDTIRTTVATFNKKREQEIERDAQINEAKNRTQRGSR